MGGNGPGDGLEGAMIQHFQTAPAVGYSLIKDGDTRTPTNTVIYHGLQPSGRYLNLIDLDSHTAGQDADRARRAFEQQFPNLNKIDWHRSQSGVGWHGYLLSNKPLPHGKLYAGGQHIGELLSTDESFSILPDDLAPGWISPTEYDLIVRFWTFQGSAQRDGGTWRGKATEGAKIAGRYTQHHIKKDALRTFLQVHCGESGKHLDELFDSRKLFNRSDAAGSLMQCLMFHIHKLLPMGGYSERCALAMAYWMAADSYGKSDNYDQETDGYALIEKIVNERPRDGGGRWRAPFWAKAHPTPIAEPAQPIAPPARPAHRPVGDREKHLAIFRRVIQAIEPDNFGRRTYTLEYLSDWMRTAKSPAAPRTIQAYLHELRKLGEIVTAQIGGNGRPYAVLTSCFGGRR